MGAAAEVLVFDGLRHNLLYEFGYSTTKLIKVATFFRQFLGGRLELDALGIPAIFHCL